MSKLSSVFITEVLKNCLISEQFLLICKNNLKYEYLENEHQKEVYRFILSTHDLNGKQPSYGTMFQAFSKSSDILTLVSDIKETVITDQEENLLTQLEEYIKNLRFADIYEETAKTFNSGDRSKAILKMADTVTEISRFTLKGGSYETVFGDFDKRQADRQSGSETFIEDSKCTTGIPVIDEDNEGGISKGSSAIILAGSGKYKSTWLRWIALANARRGNKVVYFQVEETSKKFFNKFDAGWTGITLKSIESGANIQDKNKKGIEQAKENILSGGGEIILHSSISFNSITVDDCRAHLLEIIKNKFPDGIDMVIFDYAELFTIKGNYKSDNERQRREDIANKMTNIAKEFDCAVVTASQASNVQFSEEQNTDFVLTRNHFSEFKGMIRPFSYVWSVNQTMDEADNNIVRIWMDKARDYVKSGLLYQIAIAPEVSRFFDAVKTKELNLGRVTAKPKEIIKRRAKRGMEDDI